MWFFLFFSPMFLWLFSQALIYFIKKVKLAFATYESYILHHCPNWQTNKKMTRKKNKVGLLKAVWYSKIGQIWTRCDQSKSLKHKRTEFRSNVVIYQMSWSSSLIASQHVAGTVSTLLWHSYGLLRRHYNRLLHFYPKWLISSFIKAWHNH